MSVRTDPVEEIALHLPFEARRVELGRVEGGVETIAASADRIYVARKDSPAIQVLDSSGKELATLPGHDRPAAVLVAADDGSVIASATADATTVTVWNPDGAVLRTIERPSRVKSLAIQGDTLAIGHADGSIVALSIRDPAVEHALRLPQIEKDGVSKVALSPDGKEVAGLHGAGGLIALWEIGSSKADVIILPYRLFSLRYSPDGRYLAVAGASFELSMSLSDGGQMTVSDLKSIIWLSERRTGSSSELKNEKLVFSDVHWHPDKNAVAVVATEVSGKHFHRVLSFYGVDALRQGRDRPLGSFQLGLGGVASASAFVPGKGLFVSEEDGTLLGWTVLNAEPDLARETHLDGAFSLVLVVAEESAFPFAEGLEQKLIRRIAAQPRFPLTPDVRITTLRAPALPAETRSAVQGVVWALQEQHGKRGGRWETEFYPTPVGVTFMVVYLE